MTHVSWLSGAVAAIALAFPLSAVAQTQRPATSPPAATAPSTYTDAQLRSFAMASAEIDPISRSITASSTAEQRATAATQIRTILGRHNLDGATYNAIAQRAQADASLAARIASLQTPPAGNAGGASSNQ